jgi:RNA polymerase primary sigma factor
MPLSSVFKTSTCIFGGVKWVFDGEPASGRKTGGGIADHLFERSIDSFVRETVQNSNDQRRKDRQGAARVEFAIHTLSDQFALDFLARIDWPSLSDHLRGVTATKALSKTRISRVLDMTSSLRPSMNVLVLSDYGTYGLYGDERQAEPNFANLVRHALMTDDANPERGGTYGLGKAVLWAHSDISTVLFHSLPTLKPGVDGRASLDPAGARFIGRSSLASHKVGEVSYDPDGWIGDVVVDAAGREWASSVRGDVADSTLPEWLLPQRKGDDATGTSVVIPFFGAIGREVDASAGDLCRLIREAVDHWYWPAIQSGHLLVAVSRHENGNEIESQTADGTDGVAEFVAAWAAPTRELVEAATEDRQVCEKSVTVRSPATRNSDGVPVVARHRGVEAPARLRIMRVDSATSSRHNTIALVRGPGMVVKYLRPPALGADVPGFVGVFEAGVRHPQQSPDHPHIERFLKAAEPPAHNDWVPTTDRMHKEYMPGAGARLDAMKTEIGAKVREALAAPVTDNDDGPAELARKFDLPGDKTEPATRLTMESPRFDALRKGWMVRATMSVDNKLSATPWSFEWTVEAENSFGSSPTLDIESASCVRPSALACRPSGRGYVVDVPAETRQVTVEMFVAADQTNIPTLVRDRMVLAVNGFARRVRD